MSNFDELSVRQLQIYGAVCLQNYLKFFKIAHTELDIFLQHLWSITTSKNLSNWEKEGGSIVINGRGDPLPHEVLNTIPIEKQLQLQEIIECTAEIGIIDLHGAETKQPFLFTNKVRHILRTEKIDEPSLIPLEFDNGNNHWGNPFDEELVKQIFSAYRN